MRVVQLPGPAAAVLPSVVGFAAELGSTTTTDGSVAVLAVARGALGSARTLVSPVCSVTSSSSASEAERDPGVIPTLDCDDARVTFLDVLAIFVFIF